MTARTPVLVDSHCHLNYLDDPEVCLASARSEGVRGFLCIGVDEAGADEVVALANRHDDVWATVGQHPEAAGGSLDYLETRLEQPGVVAVGEMGLDYFQTDDDAERARQRKSFDFQLALAARHKLPVVIHTRQAEEATLTLLRAYPKVTGVLHCFTESWAMAKAALDLGYYISISGIVTFKNAGNVRTVARAVPEDRLLVETDSPWLAPVPHRGRKNEPAYVTATANYLAELRGVTPERLAEYTTQNFERLFGVSLNS